MDAILTMGIIVKVPDYRPADEGTQQVLHIDMDQTKRDYSPRDPKLGKQQP